ncbi:MAG TPA: ATP-binding protein [Bacteroidales bacterium]|nr:ATP-binding protein [Bacteroidales bacterium]
MLFKDIIGQENIKNKLINNARKNKVSHAILLLGPPGSGKLALALTYAQYLNCLNPKENDSCGVCHSCLQMSKLAHPDLHFIFPTAPTKTTNDPSSKDFLDIWRNFILKNNAYVDLPGWLEAMGIENKQAYIRVKDCDDIVKILNLTSYEAGYKIMIIWLAERLYYSGAPKILKILEEPPDKTIFILIAEHQEELLPTIKSRTQIIKIPKINDDTLYQTLIEKYKCSKEKAKQIVFLSDGNYCTARNLINSEEDTAEIFNTFREWMLQCYFNNFINLNTFISNIAKLGREQLINLLTFGLKIIRDCMSINYGLYNYIRAEGQQLESIVKLSAYINTLNITSFEEEFNKAIFHIERNGNVKAILLDLSLTISDLIKIKPSN